MVENIDKNFGLLLEKLEQWKLLDNTVIVFMSDNGTTGAGAARPGQVLGKLDGRELKAFNAGMKGMKGSPDEGGVRVPFFVRWDGQLKPGQDVDRTAAHIDLFPTLAAFAGAVLPDGQVEGRSLLPLLQTPTADWPDRYLFTHTGRWKTGVDPNEHQWKGFAVRSQRFRFVNNTDLYDMEKDPGQTTNVFDQHPDVVAEMRTAYEAWWRATVPMMINEDAPMSPTRPFHVFYDMQMKSGGIPAWQPPSLD